jgi:hypothetical protein
MEKTISLGWRCESATYANSIGLRESKQDGYLTCPFDLMISNYIGVCECIKDDFKYFCDLNYLILKKCPKMKIILEVNQNDDELWIYNTYYNFTFNHESPDHGNLYNSENWPTGKNYFIENNFEKFIERYNRRIENFRYYIQNCTKINFIISRYNSIPYELYNIIKDKYQNLSFEIMTIINISQGTISITRNKTLENAMDFEIAYLEYLNININKHPEEYERYTKKLENYVDNEYSKIIYL